MYLDTAKDMPAAASAEELGKQLHDIEMLTDPAQRNYLARGADALLDATVGEHRAGEQAQSFLAGDKDVTRAQTLYQKYTWNEDKGRSTGTSSSDGTAGSTT